jgi:chemotaxis protein MotA
MLLIVGSVLVLACIIAGYLMEGGALGALIQPAELVIIGGAALGALIISTPLPLLKRIFGSFGAFFKDGPGKQDYLELLGMMYQTFRLTQQSGVMALEAHCDDPTSSSIFSRFPKFLGNHHALDFFTDSVRLIIMGGVSPFDLESMMDVDLEVHHHEALKPAAAINKVGDALPGMGIVAAVLGVVITMGAIDGPASEIGHKVGAALVGTFLGILLCYGFVGPMATQLEHKVDFDGQYLTVIKAGILALSKGLAPAIAVEFARRSIPSDLRPTFSETEAYCRAPQADAQAEAA